MRLLAALLLLLPLTVQAGEWCRSHHIGLITISKHLHPARKYNETHWGPYWRCQTGERWSTQVGWYPNSYDRDTFYGLINYVPWKFRVFGKVVKVGSSFGAGTGYAEHKDGTPKGGLSPIAGGIVALELSKDSNVGLFFNTAVVAAIVEVRWR